MAGTFVQWLAVQLNRIDSVQRCTLGADGQIIVYSWRGVIIHIHLIDQPMKTRQIKRIAQDATKIGIGTMFIVHEKLLPRDGIRTNPEEWLTAIHALMDDKIYTYRHTDAQSTIYQVHFRPTPRSDERDIWHGPSIALHTLPFFRIWVKTSPIKGDYLVANFAADPFWNNRTYRETRNADQARQQAQSGKQYQRVEFGFSGVGGDARPQMPPVNSPLAQAYNTLEINASASCDEIKSAFRRLARQYHPDTSHLSPADAAQKFRLLNEAYLYIRQKRDCS